MSATDKTRPWHVKLLDSPDLLQPVHRHEDPSLSCDLPPRPRRSDGKHPEAWNGATTRCHWSSTTVADCDRAVGCDGCALCTNQVERRRDRKRERRAGHLECADELADHGRDHDDPPFSRVRATEHDSGHDSGQWPREDGDFDLLQRLGRDLHLPDGHYAVDYTWDAFDWVVTVMAPDGTRTPRRLAHGQELGPPYDPARDLLDELEPLLADRP